MVTANSWFGLLMDEDVTNDDGATPADEPAAAKSSPLLVILGIAVVAAIGFVALFSGSDGDASSDTAVASGEFAALTEFQLATLEGDPITLAEHAGEPVVLNYFAAWCPPCAAELPDFQNVSQARIDEVTFVGISRDNETGAWAGLLESTGVTFDTYFEGNVRGSFEAVGGLAMPTTVFITADGEIAEVFSGPLNESLLNDLIDEHLVESAAPNSESDNN